MQNYGERDWGLGCVVKTVSAPVINDFDKPFCNGLRPGMIAINTKL